MKRGTVRLLLVCLISTALFRIVHTAASSSNGLDRSIVLIEQTSSLNRLDAGLQRILGSAPENTQIPVIIKMSSRVDLNSLALPDHRLSSSTLLRTLQSTAATTQEGIRDFLDQAATQGEASNITTLWILNGLSLSATPALIRKLALLPEVVSISPDHFIPAPNALPSSSTIEANISLVRAPVLWNMGFRGQGVVIATLDTGVDINHPDLLASWRGGNDSWYDPNNEHPTMPSDANGHGTWTMGVLVGQDTGGTTIGIAPDAKWISAKIFNDQEEATYSNIHKSFQWVLDPDGNPDTPDAPAVVNSSWDFLDATCDLEFEPDIQALRAAGILPIFAAGNSGPMPSTSSSPANNPGTLSVGAVDNSGKIYSYSSRGPTSCGSSSERPFPDLVAPGVNIRSTDIQGGFAESSGTSLSAPHVSGVLALLFSAYPDLTLDEQENALLQSSHDLGPLGPDGTYGNGQVDAKAAYEWIKSRREQTTPVPSTSVSPTQTSPIPTYAVTATPPAFQPDRLFFLPSVIK